ncbi:MAG TPA: HAD hydrolase-like protein, partial [Ardenticatenaceae bacterium]
ILKEIIHDEEIGASVDQTIYIGDSLMKDVAMAQDAGVTDVYAKYGIAQHREEYELLRRVTHWTQEDVERERAIYARATVTPTHVLEESFAEVLDLFEFVPHRRPNG